MSLSNITNGDTAGLFKAISCNTVNVGDSAVCVAEPTADGELGNKGYIDRVSGTAGSIYAGTASGVLITATTVETSLLPTAGVGSLTVGAGQFKVGDSFAVVLAGTIGTQNGNNLTLRWKSNGATIATQVIPLVGVVGQHFEIEIDYVILATGGAGVASIATNWDFTYSDSGAGQFRGDRYCYIDNTTFNTTVANTLGLTATFSTASANNRIQTLMMYIRQMTRF
jgi:hypothetical protein